MNKKQIASKIIAELKKKYPAPECALIHLNPWQLLVATILSAQCTDKRVNMVTPALFKKYATPAEFAAARQDDLETVIHSTGFFRNKAKNIIACARKLIEKYDGEIPQNIDDLTSLPGVGRKTASVILGTSFGKAEGIVVDTHVTRLSNRMGLTEQSDAGRIEKDLMQIIAKKNWIEFSHLLILHGRERCSARKPDCADCEINHLCPKIL
ncbi:MAG: endonuclease III [Candidatus Riflebacteria bacterium HGW-Riflebacteria-1]|jgi:endonuclease-3|nr:MAG: endonuclease III [Candidatus Riflebacteria bacterium HGW-Riflebacteria-1]